MSKQRGEGDRIQNGEIYIKDVWGKKVVVRGGEKKDFSFVRSAKRNEKEKGETTTTTTVDFPKDEGEIFFGTVQYSCE